MITRRILASAGAIGVAAAVGFFVGHTRSSAAGLAPIDATQDFGPALPAGFDVSSGALANMQLHYASATVQPLVNSLPVTGIVTYDELRLARIAPSARGRVESIDAVVGETVQAGQRLAVLDNFDLSAARSGVAGAQAAVAQAQAQLATATAALRRAEDLVNTGGMAQSELDMRRADAARAQAELNTQQATLQQWQDTEQRLMPVATPAGATAGGMADPRDSQGAVVAPFAGVVDSVTTASGQLVDPSQQIFTVADLSNVWVPLQVPEAEIGMVQLRDTAEITVDAYPGRLFIGHVAYIDDKVDPNTGTIMVRCAVPNPGAALRINMFVNATIEAPLNRSAVMIPAAALQTIDGQQAVFSPAGHGHFIWHTVQTGLTTDGNTQILTGIAPGTPIVTDGSYWLKAALMQTTIPDEG